jgi:hypothetical protein
MVVTVTVSKTLEIHSILTQMTAQEDMHLLPIKAANLIRGLKISFPEWPQCVTGVLSQANSCTQARLDMFQLAFT